jgi:nucleoside-diphosphate-sugar epimerase
MAAACEFVMRLADERYAGACAEGAVSHLNVGCGRDHTIRELAAMVGKAVGFEGEVDWDSSRPDGMPRKLLDVSRLTRLSWVPSIDLDEGLRSTYQWYCTQA